MDKAQGGTPVRLALRLMAGTAMLLSLAACDETGSFTLGQPRSETADDAVTSNSRSVRLIERDVEAPGVFQVTEPGLWDGRPSLGGVWVAHPDVTDPERVIIRNTKNGKFVIGALFRRERDAPGPAVQVSSDAAATLGMLAGAPVTLNVTALRREEVRDPAAEAKPADGTLSAPADVAETPLDPVATATTAIAAAEARPTAPTAVAAAARAAPAPQAAVAAAAAPTPQPAAAATAPKPRTGGLDKPFIQIGIFSVEQNATNTAQAMRTAGMVPTVKQQSAQGKTFWRVLVGPASSSSERSALLKKIKDKGFNDAYAVTN